MPALLEAGVYPATCVGAVHARIDTWYKDEMSNESLERPAPIMSRDAIFFWEGAKQDELRVQRCNACGCLHHPPRPMCSECLATDMGYSVMGGRGKVYSWIKPVHPPMPMFGPDLIVALVNLDEGPRIMTNLQGIDFYEISRDMPVEVFFEPTQGGYKVPQFRPVRGG